MKPNRLMRAKAKATETELAASLAVLKAEHELSSDGILVVGPKRTVISYNQRFIRMWKIPLEFVAPGSSDEMFARILETIVDSVGFLERLQHLREQTHEESHEEIELKDGRIFAFHTAPATERNGKGRYLGRVWFFRDITERKRAEREARDNAAQFRGLLEQHVAGVYVLELDCTIAYVNAHFAEMAGYKPDEMQGRSFVEFAARPDRERLRGELARLASDGVESLQTRENFARQNGSVVVLLSQCTVVDHQDRRVIIGVAIDVSRRDPTNRELRSAESRFRLLVENAPTAILLYDYDADRFIDANRSAEQLFGCSREELLEHGIRHFYNATQPEKSSVDDDFFAEHNRRALSGERVDFERRIRTATGIERICAVSLVHLPVPEGALICASCIDITERRDTERALRQLNRALMTLSAANAALVRATNELGLLQAICDVAVDIGGYAVAWIGFAEHDEAKTVRPVAWAGPAANYIDASEISWADSKRGRGPTGSAIRVGKPVINRNFETNTAMQPWLASASAHGLKSSIAVPIAGKSGIFGVMSIYSTELDAFDAEEVQLLSELGNDIAFGLTALRDRLARSTGEERLRDVIERHAGRLEALWRIANTPGLRGLERVEVMLRQAAAVIRPGQRFCGLLGQIVGDDIVVIGVGADPDDDDPRTALMHIGSRNPVATTIISRVGRSLGWDDTTTMVDVPELVVRLGWRALISTKFAAGGSQYALTLASRDPTTQAFGAEDFAYLEVLASSFANQIEVNRLEDSLRNQEERSRQHAERLEALWQIVNDSSLRDDALWIAMLRHASATIQPGQQYRASFRRIQGSEAVLEAAVEIPVSSAAGETSSSTDRAIQLEGTVISKVLAEGGGTRSWDDVQAVNDAVSRPQARGWHAMIVTTFSAGGSTWSLSFASKEAAARPLGAHEHAYIEVLASYFASHVQQRWQFDRIQYQQSHDGLTGLINRSNFRSQARMAANASDRYAVILVDINAFRGVNETYGHMTGDALLVEVGAALRHRVTDDDIVGRVGDDVFGVFPANPRSKAFARDRALDIADVFARAFPTGDREGKEFVALTACLGVAVGPDDGARFDTILSHAETALFAAKERGHGSTVCYEQGMEGDAQRRASLRTELTAAVSGDQFTLYYQPHIDINTGAVTGCEALIRWRHPTRGLLLPVEFIPFAEQTGIIANVDSWVMANALDAAKEFRLLQPAFRLYFNLSGRQAGDPSVVRAFVEASRAGVALENLGVEITESDAMRDVAATRHVCRALRKLGVRVAIDDFGTGYSSLSSLKQLPIDVVKIDRSFISGILDDSNDEAIAETILAITQRFGFESLGEGVERPEQIDWLRQRSCHYVQGYAICHPLPLDAFKSWLGAYR